MTSSLCCYGNTDVSPTYCFGQICSFVSTSPLSLLFLCAHVPQFLQAYCSSDLCSSVLTVPLHLLFLCIYCSSAPHNVYSADYIAVNT